MEEHFFQCPYCWEEISMLFAPFFINQQRLVLLIRRKEVLKYYI